MLTGETGAGKSLLIDALGLATGARADTTLVRHGAQSARVEALFDRVPRAADRRARDQRHGPVHGAPRRRDRHGRAAGPGDRRRSSRSTASTTSSGCWTRTGSGTCSTRSAGTASSEPPWPAAVDRWRANRTALAELAMDPRELLRRLEILEHEAAEIEGGATPARRGRRDHAPSSPRRSTARRSHRARRRSARRSWREGSGAREQVAHAERELRSLARLDARWGPLADRLAGLEAEVEDVAAEVRALAETVDHDPASLAALEERLGEIHRLLRRYGDDEAAVIAHGERAAVEADAAARARGRAGAPRRRRTRGCSWPSRMPAASLSILRHETAGELGRAVSAVLAELGLPAGRLRRSRWAAARRPATTLRSRSTATPSPSTRPASTPSCSPSARTPASRPGRSPGSRRAASCRASPWPSSRCSPEVDDTPTLVFDEIDTGIGGRSADPVGRSLWTLARAHQVLCVTHLPQIAAYADAHYRIAKRDRDGRTVTEITRLDRGGARRRSWPR